MSTQLPMIECSSCGKIVGHLYHDYYNALLVLESIHDKLVNGSMSLSAAQAMFDGLENGNLWEKYLGKYYDYVQKHSEFDHTLFAPKSLICHALLFHRKLEDSDLPLNEHSRDPGCVKYCCMRMLQCDNSQASY